MIEQWAITVDVVDGDWEATAFMPDGRQLHWASTDVHTLMAAIGRDLSAEGAS